MLIAALLFPSVAAWAPTPLVIDLLPSSTSAGGVAFVVVAAVSTLCGMLAFLRLGELAVDEPKLASSALLSLAIFACAWTLALLTACLLPVSSGWLEASHLGSFLGASATPAPAAVVVAVSTSAMALLAGIVSYFIDGCLVGGAPVLTVEGGSASGVGGQRAAGQRASGTGTGGSGKAQAAHPHQPVAAGRTADQKSTTASAEPAATHSASPSQSASKMAGLSKRTKPELPPKGGVNSKSFVSKPTPEKVAILHATIRKALVANYPYETFMEWDVDKSGKISKEELSRAVIDVLGVQVDKEACDSLFDFFDTAGEAGGGSGLLDYQELYRRLADGEGLDVNLKAASSKAAKKKTGTPSRR